MPYFRRMVFMETLDPSICAPARSGPQTRRPSFASRSVSPAASGPRGRPRSDRSSSTPRNSAARRVVDREGTHSAWRATPGLPGAA